MTKDLACRMARAFCAGLAFSHGAGMALDAAKWITVHPNGKGINAKGDNIKGRPCLIDSETGEILGGAGGKFTGRHISAMAQKGANEQPGAQMQITARNPKHKAEAMNGQRIGFKQVNGATAQSAQKPADQLKADHGNSERKTPQQLRAERRAAKLARAEKQAANAQNAFNDRFHNLAEMARLNQGEPLHNNAKGRANKKRQDRAESATQAAYENMNRANARVESLQGAGASNQIRSTDWNAKERLQNEINQMEQRAQKNTNFNKAVTKEFKALEKSGKLDKQSIKQMIDKQDLDPKDKETAKEKIENLDRDFYLPDLWAEKPDSISLERYEKGVDFSIPEAGISVWDKPANMTPQQKKAVQQFLFNENTREKLNAIKLSNGKLNRDLKYSRDRLKQLEKTSSMEAKTERIGGADFQTDPKEGRYNFKFEGIPSKETRTALKSAGFKWSPSRGVWTRAISPNATFALTGLKEKLKALS